VATHQPGVIFLQSRMMLSVEGFIHTQILWGSGRFVRPLDSGLLPVWRLTAGNGFVRTLRGDGLAYFCAASLAICSCSEAKSAAFRDFTLRSFIRYVQWSTRM
jgi:hypothetical protein